MNGRPEHQNLTTETRRHGEMREIGRSYREEAENIGSWSDCKQVKPPFPLFLCVSKILDFDRPR
jgi:hypothetical protein